MSVLNISFYDSDNENDEFGGGETEDYNTKRVVTPDEESHNCQEILEKKIKDIGTVSVLGKNYFRIDFYDVNFDLMDNTTECDFDLDLSNEPIIYDGGQEFIVPYLYKLKSYYPILKNAEFETNNNFTFKIN